ncbi:MAG: amidohydrolase family protein [Bacteroidetes bacterium]|nr:amidohydrolase family protein [Bacteroidota bacterium]
MKIIDAHIHIGKWSDIFFGYESTVEEAVRVMKNSGVDAALCMPADKTPNEEMFRLTKSKADFNFYYNAWIDPSDKDLDSFLEINIKEISAFKIHPSIQRLKITDPSYEKYLRLAAETGKPVVVHCGRWQEMAGFRIALEAAAAHPELKLILAHMGGDQPSLYLECAEIIRESRYKNVYLGTESVREFYFMDLAVKKAGAEKVIFGSDYNLGLPLTYIPIVDSLNISNEEKEMIFSGNILKLISA